MTINQTNESLNLTLSRQFSDDRETRRGSSEIRDSSSSEVSGRTTRSVNVVFNSMKSSSNTSSRGSSDAPLYFSSSDSDSDYDSDFDLNTAGTIEQISVNEEAKVQPRYQQQLKKDFPYNYTDEGVLVGVTGRDSWQIFTYELRDIVGGIFTSILSKIDESKGGSFEIEAGPYEFMSRGGMFRNGITAYLDVRKIVRYVDMRLQDETGARIGQCVAKKVDSTLFLADTTGSVVTITVESQGSRSLKQLCFEKILQDPKISSPFLEKVKAQKEFNNDAQEKDAKEVEKLLSQKSFVVSMGTMQGTGDDVEATSKDIIDLVNLLTRHFFNNPALLKNK